MDIVWIIALALVGVLAVVLIGVAIYNAIIGAKCKKMQDKEIKEKETALQRKLGKLPPEDEVAEETQIEPEEEEKTEEPVEETEEKVEEEVAEEKAEEPAEEEEVKEEPTQEQVEEEVKEEQPAEEEKAEEIEEKEEPAEEEKADDADYSKEAEELLKDVPNAEDNVVEEKEEVKEEPTEEQVEETKVEPAPSKKAPAKKAKAKAEKAPLPKKAPAKSATKNEPTADGKWILIADSEGYYYGELKANNGQLLLTTERYKGVTGIKNGIETIKKNLAKDNYEISVDKNNTANFKLFGSNAGLLCIGEGYSTKENAESAINSVKHFADSPIIVSDEVSEIEEKKYEITSAEKNDGGKWLIVDTKDGYLHAELKANNGQVLLVTENYKGVNSLNSGLETIKKNVSNGNFGVKKDKNDNYNFKIFSENKRLLGLGAGYSSLASCESAINSVMRFCDSPVIENNED